MRAEGTAGLKDPMHCGKEGCSCYSGRAGQSSSQEVIPEACDTQTTAGSVPEYPLFTPMIDREGCIEEEDAAP